jgi:hypothetical protein
MVSFDPCALAFLLHFYCSMSRHIAGSNDLSAARTDLDKAVAEIQMRTMNRMGGGGPNDDDPLAPQASCMQRCCCGSDTSRKKYEDEEVAEAALDELSGDEGDGDQPSAA